VVRDSILYLRGHGSNLRNFTVSRCKALTVFTRSRTGIVGSNPTEGRDICVCVYSAFVFSYV
jgi:hypothetical protein